MAKDSKVHRRLTGWRREPIPPEHLAMAERRVSFLEGAAFTEPMRYLLACAYLQGINDCCAAHHNNPSLLPAAKPDNS